MNKPTKQNAPNQGGAPFTKRAGRVTGQKNVFRCGNQHTSKLKIELQAQGLALTDSSGRSQCETLLRVLKYLGPRGINTLEGNACGYLRIATRIQELQALGHVILSPRENLIGPDGLFHQGIARYVWIGHGQQFNPQGSLDLGDPQ